MIPDMPYDSDETVQDIHDEMFRRGVKCLPGTTTYEMDLRIRAAKKREAEKKNKTLKRTSSGPRELVIRVSLDDAELE
jgi:hypothetical protein